MSLHLEFEPHSWYMGFAIQDYRQEATGVDGNWAAYIDNGNTYRVDMLEADTLADLKQQIRAYHKHNAERDAYNRARLGE